MSKREARKRLIRCCAHIYRRVCDWWRRYWSIFQTREKGPGRWRLLERRVEWWMRSSIGGNESENPPAARVATIFMGLLVRASDSRPREFASLPAQGPNKSWLKAWWRSRRSPSHSGRGWDEREKLMSEPRTGRHRKNSMEAWRGKRKVAKDACLWVSA